MSESLTPTGSQGSETRAAPENNVRRHRPWLAALLSLLAPGLGQVYNEQLLKGFAFMIVGWLAGMLAFFLLLRTFYGLIIFLLLFVTLYVYGCFNAYKNAHQRKIEQAPSRVSLASRVGATILILGFNLVVSSDYAMTHFYPLHAYKIPSASMCPTVCEGDRAFANLTSFRKSSPHRGDVVAFQFDEERRLHIKRVAAVGGDAVSVSNGRLLVNGSPAKTPTSACGSSIPQSGDYNVPQEFIPMQVPQNSVFLLGDNAENSFDSRFFGAQETSRVRGRLLYLYWSPEHGRIGCAIK